MKNKLYPRIYDLKNLWQSWNRIKEKSSTAGIDRVSLEDYSKKIESNLKDISISLRTETYIPEPYKRVHIPKYNLRESRKISIPTIRDKIVQEATRRVIEPIFNSTFIENSFAYRANMGPQKAIHKVETYLKEGNTWVVTYDIDNFFDTINHSLLMKTVSNRIWEKEILRLIELWLKMGCIKGKEWIDPLIGVPQGSNISPLLSNIYLNIFDVAMKNKGYKIVRYADNMLCLETGRREVIGNFKVCEDFLSSRLSLKINPDSISITNVHNGFVFLGFLFKHTKKIIANEKIEKIKSKIVEILKEENSFQNRIYKLNESIIGWRRYYQIGDVSDQFKFLDGILNDQLINILKLNTINKKDIINSIQRLEFFIEKDEREKQNLISLLVAGSNVSKFSKKENTLLKEKKYSISQEIRKKRKKYENILSESANLIITSPGSFIGKKSSRVMVKEKHKIVKEVPFQRLKNIFIVSDGVSLSSNLIKSCVQEEISVKFLDFFGKPYAYIISPKNYFFKAGILQLSAINDCRGIYLAKSFVKGKIKNQINLIKYYKKYKERKAFEFSQQCDDRIEKMQSLLKKLLELTNDEGIEYLRPRLMNIEGQVAAYYWGLIKLLLSKDVYFEGRERRGATDIVNSLLNYGYGILYSEIYQSIVFTGLNPNISFLHKEQFGKPTLVFDLIEEFRQPVVDKTIIGMIRKKEKFQMEGTLLTQESKKKVIKKIIKRLNKKIVFHGRNLSFQEIIRSQAKSIVQYLEGKEIYYPFIDKW